MKIFDLALNLPYMLAADPAHQNDLLTMVNPLATKASITSITVYATFQAVGGHTHIYGESVSPLLPLNKYVGGTYRVRHYAAEATLQTYYDTPRPYDADPPIRFVADNIPPYEIHGMLFTPVYVWAKIIQADQVVSVLSWNPKYAIV